MILRSHLIRLKVLRDDEKHWSYREGLAMSCLETDNVDRFLHNLISQQVPSPQFFLSLSWDLVVFPIHSEYCDMLRYILHSGPHRGNAVPCQTERQQILLRAFEIS